MDEQKLLKKKRRAQVENNNPLLLIACTDLACLYASQGKYDLAIEEYEIMGKVYKSEKKQMDYARAMRGVAEAYIGLNKFDKALEHNSIYLDIARKENDKLEEQRALATIGHLYLSWFLTEPDNKDRNVHLQKAYKMFMKSLMVCESITDISKSDKVDMTARLFYNLGVVQESMGNFEKAEQLMGKSIELCKQHDILTELHRGYNTMANLFEKKMDYKNALVYYNLAIPVAKSLKQHPELLCSTLLGKSETLIKMGDFHSAKPVLYKAYKLKSPIKQENKLIERMLRVVAVMCKTEDKLLMTGDQPKEVKKLYEKMGDCACDLKNYSQAIEYYLKGLEAAQKCGASEKELAICYYSLGATYSDNGQFDKAVEYFEKEYAAVETNLHDSLNTLSKIADTKELAKCPMEDVKLVYERAFRNCQKKNNVKEELRMVTRCLNYLRRNNHHHAAYDLEQHLNEVEKKCNSQDFLLSEEEPDSESEERGNIGDDISLDNLTEMSDDSDNDTILEGKQQRPKRKRNLVVKNVKGETRLHLAAIKGDLLVAQVLVDQGHPVNVRDHAGWLPLHEAANNGHLQIVELLLDNGSAINDRGASQGISALHDAAFNGHVEIMELLLDRGASAIILTDDGVTPLQALQEYMQNNPTNEEKYDRMVKRLSETMEKAGQQVKQTGTTRLPTSLIAVNKENIAEPKKMNLIQRNRSFNDFSNRSKDLPVEAANEYRQVMSSLKHKNTTPVQTPESGTKRSSLIGANDLGDDWLEDDMPSAKKKRRINMSMRKISPTSLRRSTSQRRISVESHTSLSSEDNIPEDCFNDFQVHNMDIDDCQVVPEERRNSNESCLSIASSSKSGTSRRTSQVSLLDAGFVRCKTPTLNTQNNKNKTPLSGGKQTKKQQYQLMLTNSRFSKQATENVTVNLVDSPEKRSPPKSMTISDPTLFVDVRIEGRLYRVPVLMSQVQSHTIKWLAEQAANRYASKEYMKPTLELETKNGAFLADDDLLSLIFPMGSMQAEPVEAKVLKWSLPPLVDRYRESCAHMNTDMNPILTQLAEEMSDCLSIANKGLRGAAIAPFTKAINHQTNLQTIDFCCNFLDTDCVKLLCSSIVTLTNLEVLNLSCTGLQTSHLSLLANSIRDNPPKRLSGLNLSDNLLKNESLTHLKIVTEHATLVELNISAIGLKNGFAQPHLQLNKVQKMDISENDLDLDDTKKLLASLSPKILKLLNLNKLKCTTSGLLRTLEEDLFNLEIMPDLETIQLSRSNIDDSELFNLLWHHNKNLATINLSYNQELTGLSMRRLLEHPSLKRINLIGCQNIFNNFDYNVITPVNRQNIQEFSIKSYVDNEAQAVKFVDTLKRIYCDFKVIVEQLPNFIWVKMAR